MPRTKSTPTRSARNAPPENGHVTLTDEAYAALEELIVHGQLGAGVVVHAASILGGLHHEYSFVAAVA